MDNAESSNTYSYDSSSDEEIIIRLNKLEKQISTLYGINHKQIIKKSKKIFKLINKEFDKKEKTIEFLRDENYDLQGQVYFYKNCLYKELIETITSFFDKLLDELLNYIVNTSVIQYILDIIKNFIPQPFFDILFEFGIDYIHPKKWTTVKNYFGTFFLPLSFIPIFIFRLPIIRTVGDLFIVFCMTFIFLIYYVNVTFGHQYLVLIVKE
jgi:hypothetical protein